MKKLLLVLTFLFTFSIGYSAVIGTDCKDETKIEKSDFSKADMLVDNVMVIALDNSERVTSRKINTPLDILATKPYTYTGRYFAGDLSFLYREKLIVRQINWQKSHEIRIRLEI